MKNIFASLKAMNARMMASLEKPEWRAISAVLTVVAFWGIFKNPFYALALFGAMFLHEVAHALVLEANGIKTEMLFIPLMGAVTKPKKDSMQKANELPWVTMAWMLLVGPLTNSLLGVAGYNIASWSSDADWKLFWTMFGGLNISLAMFNLLPLPGLDGGQFLKTIFSSWNEEWDKLAMVFSIVAVVGAFVTLAYIGKLELTPMLMVWGIHQGGTTDNPDYHKSKQAIPKWYAVALYAGWAVLLLGHISASRFLPGWIEILRGYIGF